MTKSWSCRKTKRIFLNNFEDFPESKENYLRDRRCRNCVKFVKFEDFGLCLNVQSKHYKETIYQEHTCECYVIDWGKVDENDHQ